MADDIHLVFQRTGGPNVLTVEPLAAAEPGTGEVLIRHEAIGLNFIDTYHRSGLYPLSLPSGLGTEAAGIIEAVGPGIQDWSIGDRVAYAGGTLGAYSSARIMPADRLVKLPDRIDMRTAAAVMLKGLTADMLVGECGRVSAGDIVLLHAAAGGVGTLLVPWLKSLNAIVIAHAGSPEKAQCAQAAGADHALSCPFDDLAATVRELTGGWGVDLVLDGVGQASWEASLDSLAKRGLMVSYGNASGAVPAIEPLLLSRKGSLFLTRPTMFDYIDTRERLDAAAHRLFAMLEKGILKAEIGQTFYLADAAEAHRAIEGRLTTGSTILIP